MTQVRSFGREIGIGDQTYSQAADVVVAPSLIEVTLCPERLAVEGNLLRQFLRRVGPDFRKCWMIMRRGGKLMRGHMFRHRHNDLVDQFATRRPDATAAEDFARFRIRQQFHKAVERFHDK